MTERNIAAEVLEGLREIRDHRAGKHTLKTVRVEPRPLPELTPEAIRSVDRALPSGGRSRGFESLRARNPHWGPFRAQDRGRIGLSSAPEALSRQRVRMDRVFPETTRR